MVQRLAFIVLLGVLTGGTVAVGQVLGVEANSPIVGTIATAVAGVLGPLLRRWLPSGDQGGRPPSVRG